MSCGTSCPCQFNWPLDTQGSRRDPVNSEKAWLDSAVRFLSREEVGKGRGQETVWSERCKPHWWDKTVGLPWKNPTANPKDTKEVLLKKYTALEKHLQEESRFPSELAEEARLWNEGRHKELFLLTSLTSLLGKVTGVHTATVDATGKVDELKAEVNKSLLSDIKRCLASTLQLVENLGANKVPQQKTGKRKSISNGKENSEFTVPTKQAKIEKTQMKSKNTSQTNTDISSASSSSLNQSADILTLAHKLLNKRKDKINYATPPRLPAVIQPKLHIIAPKNTIPVTVSALSCSVPPVTITPTTRPTVSSPPYCITVSEDQLNHLLTSSGVNVDFSIVNQSDVVPSVRDHSHGSVGMHRKTNAQIPDINKKIQNSSSTSTQIDNYSENTAASTLAQTYQIQTSSPHQMHSGQSQSSNNLGKDIIDELFNSEFTSSHTASTSSISSPHPDGENTHMFEDLFEIPVHAITTSLTPSFFNNNQNPNNPLTLDTSDVINLTEKDAQISPVLPNSSEASYILQNAHISNITSTSTSATSSTTRRISDCVESQSSFGSQCHDSHQVSDSGYCSESTGSPFDLDLLFSPEEQNDLLKEDGDYLLDRFISDLDQNIFDSFN